MLNFDVNDHVPSAIERGVLALRAARVIERFLDGEHLSLEDREVCKRASAFLQLITAGATLASHRPAMQGFGASASIDALGQALTPFSTLREIINDADVVEFFQELQRTVFELGSGNVADVSKEKLSVAGKFFRALDESLRANLGVELMPLSKYQNKTSALLFS